MLRVMYGAHFSSVLLFFLPCCLASSHNEVFEGPSNITYCATANDLPIELTCKVSGVAAWIVNETRYTLDQINQTLEGHDRNGTNILVYSPASNAKYTCVSLTNDDDVRSDPAYITVIAPPMTAPTPTITGTTPLSSTSFTVSWTITDSDYIYIITRTNLHTGMMEDSVTVPENTSSYDVPRLSSNDRYNVIVTANNSCGKMMSDPITIDNLQISTPLNITIPQGDITRESFVVQWDPVTILAINYTVRWCGGDGNNGMATVNGLLYTVTGLTANTSYNVTVVAMYCGEVGPVSEVVMVMTNNNPPTNPPASSSTVVPTLTPTPDVLDEEDDDNIGVIIGVVVAVIIIIIIIVTTTIIIIYCYLKKKKGLESADGDRQELKSPPATGGTHKPSTIVPHQTAASGEEYAVATTKPVTTKPQQPADEYAMVDKTKKHAAATQGIHYADLQDLPASGNKPPTNQGPTATYAQVA